MSNLFVLRKKAEPTEFRRKPLRMMLSILFGLMLVAVIVYLTIVLVIRPNLTVSEVVISYVDQMPAAGQNDHEPVPLPPAASRLSIGLKGVAFKFAEPDALETALAGLDEILTAEVRRFWSGRLEILLVPRTPIALLAMVPGERAAAGPVLIPLDGQGEIYSASQEFIAHFGRTIPVIEVHGLANVPAGGASVMNVGRLPAGLISFAGLLDRLRSSDPDTFSLIKRMKYDTSTRQPAGSLTISAGSEEIEFSLAQDLAVLPLASGIRAVVRMREDGSGMPSVRMVAVFNDSVVCRL